MRAEQVRGERGLRVVEARAIEPSPRPAPRAARTRSRRWPDAASRARRPRARGSADTLPITTAVAPNCAGREAAPARRRRRAAAPTRDLEGQHQVVRCHHRDAAGGERLGDEAGHELRGERRGDRRLTGSEPAVRAGTAPPRLCAAGPGRRAPPATARSAGSASRSRPAPAARRARRCLARRSSACRHPGGEGVEQTPARVLALLGMELHGEDVVARDRRGERAAVVGAADGQRRVRAARRGSVCTK